MATTSSTDAASPQSAHKLYLLVLAGIVLGVIAGFAFPQWAVQLKPLGDLFIRLVKALVAPIVFCTVVSGIASAGDLKRVGRVGLSALIYFEVMTTLALCIGWAVVHVVRPGDGLMISPDAATLPAVVVPEAPAHLGWSGHLLKIVPESFFGPFVSGEVLQVLFLAVLVGVATAKMKEKGAPFLSLIDTFTHVLFGVLKLIMWLAPIGAFGAMAYTVGKFGLESIWNLAKLMLAFYATSLVFVLGILGLACRYVGISIFRLLRYLREELLIVLGTSSSESVLPQLMLKLEALGARSEVVRLVVPTGYSFNLDGTSIYLTMGALFVAQATGTHLTLGQEFSILLVLLLTSKGAAGVTGSGLVTLAATLSSIPIIPISGLSTLVGIDRFMSEARALTNVVGNAVATLVIAKFQGALNLEQARTLLNPSNPSTPADSSSSF